jgi:hypothetical protein
MKTRPVGAEMLLADGRSDGRTDRYDEATSRFSQFCEVPKNHIKSGGNLRYFRTPQRNGN